MADTFRDLLREAGIDDNAPAWRRAVDTAQPPVPYRTRRPMPRQMRPERSDMPLTDRAQARAQAWGTAGGRAQQQMRFDEESARYNWTYGTPQQRVGAIPGLLAGVAQQAGDLLGPGMARHAVHAFADNRPVEGAVDAAFALAPVAGMLARAPRPVANGSPFARPPVQPPDGLNDLVRGPNGVRRAPSWAPDEWALSRRPDGFLERPANAGGSDSLTGYERAAINQTRPRPKLELRVDNPDAPTRLPVNPSRPPTRASDGSILPARAPQPFRQSLVGGSEDLRAAAQTPRGPDAGSAVAPQQLDVFHGARRPVNGALRPGNDGVVWSTTDADAASYLAQRRGGEGANVIRGQITPGNYAIHDSGGAALSPQQKQQIIDQARASGRRGVVFVNDVDGVAGARPTTNIASFSDDIRPSGAGQEPLASSVGGVPIPQVIRRDFRNFQRAAVSPPPSRRAFQGVGGQAVALSRGLGPEMTRPGPRIGGIVRANPLAAQAQKYGMGLGLLGAAPTTAGAAWAVNENVGAGQRTQDAQLRVMEGRQSALSEAVRSMNAAGPSLPNLGGKRPTPVRPLPRIGASAEREAAKAEIRSLIPERAWNLITEDDISRQVDVRRNNLRRPGEPLDAPYPVPPSIRQMPYMAPTR